MTRRQPNRRGFVLVLTLLVLAITVMMVAGFARFSLVSAVEHSRHEWRIRRKWAVASCQRVALENASRLLRTANGQHQPSGDKRKRGECFVQLDGMTYHLLLSDESAKANLNKLVEVTNVDETETIAARLVENLEWVSLRPSEKTLMGEGANRFPLGSWDQVFQSLRGGRLTPAELIGLTRDVTLWSGRLHIAPASDEAIFETLCPIIGSATASRLVSELGDRRNRPVADLIRAASASGPAAETLTGLLSDQSDCFGVWVRFEDRSGEHASLAVRRYFTPTLSRTFTFGW